MKVWKAGRKNAIRRFFYCTALIFSIPLSAQNVLRGEISEELEPVYAVFLGIPSPIDNKTAILWALEDSAAAFAGMIYGWNFEYEPGERSRNIPETLDLNSLGAIQFGDRRMSISDTRVENDMFYLSSDYTLSPEQEYRIKAWNASTTVGINTIGYASLQGNPGITDRRMIKFSALEDAVKKAIRSYFRSIVKNRPRAIKGYIALSQFPSFRIAHGQWAATARFRLQMSEIVPFSVY
ncbi:MAG: hypothetical protein LBV68_00545 [Spirochaetaceae bacterium]|jgi:hypothetical protein|nr:hypothetical protein [Spirochaetaceae bacterium]